MKTWKPMVPFAADGHLDLICPHCGTEARMPTQGNPGCLIVAACGLGLVTDPPGAILPNTFMPPIVQCRTCRNTWAEELVAGRIAYEAANVR